MAMSLGGGNTRQRAEMNVTPLIDVLLVLIIIFMVVIPQNSLGLDTKLPQQSTIENPQPETPSRDLVITVQANQMVRLNQDAPLALAELGNRLQTLFGGAVGRVIFIRAEKDLDFQQVAEVIDVAKGAGLSRIALMTQ